MMPPPGTGWANTYGFAQFRVTAMLRANLTSTGELCHFSGRSRATSADHGGIRWWLRCVKHLEQVRRHGTLALELVSTVLAERQLGNLH